jgi:hypothetical protein|tara:strand:+ start:386 stop:838 length:453 start_codon:yes stop_codon:yes gene_type:complete
MNKEQKEQLKYLIAKVNTAYDKLSFLNNITWKEYREILFKMNRKGEAEHRNWGSSFEQFHQHAATTSICAKMFTVKDIATALLDIEKFSVKSLLHIKYSCIYAQSIAENYKEEILKAWSDENIKFLSKLDYCNFVSPQDMTNEDIEKAVA